MATKTRLPSKIISAFKDIDRDIIRNGKEISNTIDVKTQQRIINQVETEYDLCISHNEAKRTINLARLKLYNNQRRDSKAVGDPLLFTVFNTIHASLYEDRLNAGWEGRGGQGDEDVEDNLNALSKFDYDVMQKNKLDYFWNWDAEFFGRGLVLMMEFNREVNKMSPIPELIDAITFIRDPRATSVNGINGKGAMRFGGWEVGASYYELKGMRAYFNLSSLRKDKDIKSLLDEARSARRLAQGLEDFYPKEESLGKFDNYEFRLINWFTTIKGEKYLVTLGNRRTSIIRLLKLDYNGWWPMADRTIYPMSNDWDSVSIPDLTEDKQRAKAVLLNLGLMSAKSDVIPSYLYDQTRIKNKNDLNFKVNKFIGVDGRVDNAIMAVQKSTAHQYVNLITEILDAAAQRATATPEIQQGIQPTKERTLGELELVSSKVDTRYSMSAKVFGWSERDFWLLWYVLYKKHFKDEIDEKIVRIRGAMTPVFRPLKRENIIAMVDPDVRIESRVVSEAKRLQKQRSFDPFAAVVLQDPDNNKRFVQKFMAKLRGLTKEEITLIFPPTVDELQAEDENVLLNESKLPEIKVTDDHKTHLEIHAKADQNKESVIHIRAHKKQMIVRRDRPDLFPPDQTPGFQLPGQGQQVRPQQLTPATR